MSKALFIAEAGKNFIMKDKDDDYLGNAKNLIKIAKESGADIVKFQCHVFEDEQKFRHPDRHEWIKFNESITTAQFWKELKQYCDEMEIEFMCTPMSKMAAEKINSLVRRWKIGSGNVTDIDLLHFIAETGKPVILSTGMSTQKEVENALEILKNNEVSLFYCKSIYPCPIEKIDFLAMHAMKDYFKKKFQNVKRIGFSDHTLEITTPMMAVIEGEAEIIEKHFTLDKKAFGPDHRFSLEPNELKLAIKLVRDYENFGNEDSILIYPEEEEIKLWESFRV